MKKLLVFCVLFFVFSFSIAAAATNTYISECYKHKRFSEALELDVWAISEYTFSPANPKTGQANNLLYLESTCTNNVGYINSNLLDMNRDRRGMPRRVYELYYHQVLQNRDLWVAMYIVPGFDALYFDMDGANDRGEYYSQPASVTAAYSYFYNDPVNKGILFTRVSR